jgi:hypothetical protein
MPIEHSFGSDAKSSLGSLLRTRLKNGASLGDLAVNGLAFREEMSHRLFAVDILAASQGFECAERVPMIGCGHYDRIDIVAGAEFTEISIAFAALERVILHSFGVMCFDELFGRLSSQGASSPRWHIPVMQIVNVADSDHLGVIHLQEILKIARTHGPKTNYSDSDPVAGRGTAGS